VIEQVAAQVFIRDRGPAVSARSMTCGGSSNAGADKISINTAAVQSPQLVGRCSGPLRVAMHRRCHRRTPPVAAIRCRAGRCSRTAAERQPDSMRSPGRNRSRRWRGEILLTSMDRDGNAGGFDIELTRAVSDAVSVPVIASGGVGTLAHSGRRGSAWARRCGAGCEHFSLRRIYGAAGKAVHGLARHRHESQLNADELNEMKRAGVAG